jgi:hypothetical protein
MGTVTARGGIGARALTRGSVRAALTEHPRQAGRAPGQRAASTVFLAAAASSDQENASAFLRNAYSKPQHSPGCAAIMCRNPRIPLMSRSDTSFRPPGQISFLHVFLTSDHTLTYASLQPHGIGSQASPLIRFVLSELSHHSSSHSRDTTCRQLSHRIRPNCGYVPDWEHKSLCERLVGRALATCC